MEAKGPDNMNFPQALEQEARFTPGGELDAQTLMGITFEEGKLSDSAAITFLQRYKQSKLNTGEKALLQRCSNQLGGLEAVIPSSIYKAYMFSLSIADDDHVSHLIAERINNEEALNSLALSVFFYANSLEHLAGVLATSLQRVGYHNSTKGLKLLRSIAAKTFAETKIATILSHLSSLGVQNVDILTSTLKASNRYTAAREKREGERHDYFVHDIPVDGDMTVPRAKSLITEGGTKSAAKILEICTWFIERFMKDQHTRYIPFLYEKMPQSITSIGAAVTLITYLDEFLAGDKANYESETQTEVDDTEQFVKSLRERIIASLYNSEYPDRFLAEFHSTDLKDSPLAQEIFHKVLPRTKNLGSRLALRPEILEVSFETIKGQVRSDILTTMSASNNSDLFLTMLASVDNPGKVLAKALYGRAEYADAEELLARAGLGEAEVTAFNNEITILGNEAAVESTRLDALAKKTKDENTATAAEKAAKVAEKEAKAAEKEAAKLRQQEFQKGREVAAAKKAEAQKGKITPKEFESRIAKPYAALNITPHLAHANFPPRQTLLAEEIQAYLELDAWQEGDTERLIAVEPESLLGRLGIQVARITKKEDRFDIDFEFPEQDGHVDRFHATSMNLTASEYIGEQELHSSDHHAIVRTEGARMFAKLLAENLDDTCAAADLHDVLMLLTLEDLPPVEATPKPDPKPEAPKPKAPKEAPETAKMREFLRDNHEAFESFVIHLRDHDEFSIGDSLRNLISHVKKLAAKIQTKKQVHHQGIDVEIQDGHKLSNHVSKVKIFDPVQTRVFLEKLNLKPEFIHVDLDMLKDSYHCVADVVTQDGQVVEIHACIVPPDNEVYVFGVDPTETFEDEKGSDPQQEKKIAAAFIHLLLLSFRKVVDRDDDPDNVRGDSPKNGKTRRPGQDHINRIITAATGTAYPLLVESWNQDDLDTAPEAESDGEVVEETEERGSALIEQTLNEIPLDELHLALAISGACLHAQDAWALLDRIPQFKDTKARFPNSAFANGSRSNLKVENEKIYVPIDDPALVAEVLGSIKEDKMLTQDTGSDDAQAWFNSHLASGDDRRGLTHQAFAFAIKTSNAIAVKTTPQFSRLCVQLHGSITSETEKQAIDKYAYLFQEALELAQYSAPAGMEVSEEDVFDALLKLSLFNPDKLFLPTSAAATMRNPYRYRYDTKNAPDEVIFKGTDFETDAELTDNDVVVIIDGNRAKFNAINSTWLRGNNRSDRANIAAKVQDQHKSPESGPQLNLEGRARALLVYEFEDENGPVYAYRYLDTARSSTSSESLVAIPAETKLMNFPRVQREITRAKVENATGDHKDFADLSRWSRGELLQLEAKGIFELIKSGGQDGKRVKVHGIVPDSQLKIKRKKVVIFKGEQVGYRQFSSRPATYAQYQDYLYETMGDDQLHDEMQGYDPKRAHIQAAIYELLGLAPSFRQSLAA
ncbi:hypothetical protein JKY72_00880 [Candidatus Gracilibacteria bacterium]|nr:hypothetical protein [Candidatus Gracilibacteria bacterium]